VSGALRLIATFARIGLANELAYRANFWFQAFESTLGLATALAAVGVVFRQTETLGGWQAEELVALVGVYYLVYGAINLVIAPSLERFMEDVRQGTLDFTLTKPEDAQLLVSVCEFRVWKLCDVALGAGVLAIALARLSVDLGPGHALAFGIALLAGSAIVYGFWIVLASCAFWFVRVENLMMIFWSMYTAGRWPVGIYPTWLRWTLTLVVPVAFAVTVPAEAVAGRLELASLAGAVALAVALLAGSRALFRLGLRRYSGASA
jgi:ABC-2 type transport system permease protein